MQTLCSHSFIIGSVEAQLENGILFSSADAFNYLCACLDITDYIPNQKALEMIQKFYNSLTKDSIFSELF